MKATNQKKRNETMASVLSESVVEALIEEFSQNDLFVGTYENSKAYIGLFFNTADIGGLSKKTNRDEAKGAFVEQIKSGRIKALITPELLNDNSMVIVPDAVTIEAMSEFSMLSDVDFKVCYVTPDCKIILTDKTAKISDCEYILQSDAKAEDVFFKKDEPAYESVVPELPVTDNAQQEQNNDGHDIVSHSEDLPDNSDAFEEDEILAPVSTDISDEELTDEPIDDMNVDTDEPSDFNDDDYNPEDFIADADEPDDDVVADDESDTDEDVIPDEAVEATVIRKFYSSELGLEITADPFDLQFTSIDTYVPFAEDRGKGWLNEYLSNMSKDANTEMQRMHKDNMASLRKTYLSLLSLYCEDVQKQLDINDKSTRYGQINNGLKAQRIDAKKNVDKEVIKRKQVLENAWNEKLKQVGEDAAHMAERQYRERFGEAHDAEMYRIEATLNQEIEDSYQDAVRMMNTDRQNEARKLLDYGINSVLKEVTNMYDTMVSEEQARYKELQQGMFDFIDSNRKDEVARIETLKAEQERNSKVQQVMQEYNERINTMKAEFEANRSVLKGELDNIQRDNAARLKQNQQDYESRLQDAKAQNESLQKRLDDLLNRYSNIDKIKDMEYTTRIKELTSERDSWKDKCNHDADIHKRANMTAVFLTIIAVIAAIAIGFIAGYAISSSKAADAVTSISQAYVQNNDVNQSSTPDTTTANVPKGTAV